MPNEFNIMPAMRVSATGLDAESRRMEVIANNIANANTTAAPGGNAYHRKQVIFAAKLASEMNKMGQERVAAGVEVKQVAEDTRPDKLVYRPGHPDADKDGNVRMPDINVLEEMVDMMGATRAYEANLAAIKTSRAMATQALGIGR